ncbi:MAG: hypothetical protein NZ825_14365 [Candidatus Marinimicrobia bacterium]|nr:hypothetical protein [Candidatus Neomarinimicrobiota bacterium]
MRIVKLYAIILSFSFSNAQDVDSIGPDLGIYTGFLDIKADSMGVPLFLNGIFIGETPLVDPIPVLPGFHEVSYLPPEETERVRNHVMFSDAVKRIYVPPGAVKQVFLYYQNQYSYLRAARVQARVVRYVGIAFIIFFMELIWLTI